MDKLTFLDELSIMVSTGEVKTVEGTEKSIRMLEDMKLLVIENLHNEIVRDVTDKQTEYFAPEYNTWHDFLAACNGYADYEKVLHDCFSQEELEALWQNSHITEELTDKEIKEELLLQIGQLKMLEITGKAGTARNPVLAQQVTEMIRARMQGLYNILYEA